MFLNTLGFLEDFFFPSYLCALELSDVIVNFLLNCTSSLFLRQCCLVCNLDFFTDDLDSFSLGLLGSLIFCLDLLDVCFQLGFLLLSHFFLLGSLLLARCDLIDNDLGSSFAGNSSAIFSFELCLDCFQSFDFHHQVKSLLLFNPVLLESVIFCELTLSHGQDF